MSVPEQLTIESEEDDGLTWHKWFLSLSFHPEAELDDPRVQEAQDWPDEAE